MSAVLAQTVRQLWCRTVVRATTTVVLPAAAGLVGAWLSCYAWQKLQVGRS